ncbi:hypothetical protein Ahy_B08g091460 [Arachis hypogaea]|uniref:Uncharacterized protein n=1 Tax=Arachis hypogaea TaxID=3818 RepID=A0A444Y267_ARAHY|nr:hypothetical protein Ahy_B08g091460 [Arachis hypogaea]
MLPSATFSVAGTTTGVPTIFSGEFWQLGYHAETDRSRKLRIHFSCSCRAKERPSQRFLKLNSKRRCTLLTFAFGKEVEDSFFSDVGEDTDEMYDELFKNYGKVVFKRKDQKPATAEVDDDAESLSCYETSNVLFASHHIPSHVFSTSGHASVNLPSLHSIVVNPLLKIYVDMPSPLR